MALDITFHDLIMRTSRNRIARAVVRSLEGHVLGSPQYMGRPKRALRVESNAGHERVMNAIGNRDPEGARAAMFAHITDAWLVRRGSDDNAERLRRS